MSPAVQTSRRATPRWDRWQSTAVAERYLSPQMRAFGYTIVRVHPDCQDAFLDTMALLKTYSQWASRPGTPPVITRTFLHWCTWTVRLGAVLRWLLERRSSPFPTVPVELETFVTREEHAHEA